MARSVVPESKLKAQRRRRRLVMLYMSLAVIILIAVVAVLLLHVNALRIRDVVVKGNETVGAAAIVSLAMSDLKGSYAYIIPKNSIFFYPSGRIANDLKERYPQISYVDAHAQTFTSIEILVKEYQPMAVWCGDMARDASSSGTPPSPRTCLFLNEDGLAYAYAPQFSGNAYIPFYGPLMGGSSTPPAQYLSTPTFQALVALVQAIAQKVGERDISDVFVDGYNDVFVRFGVGMEIRFSLNDDGGVVMQRISAGFSSEPLMSHAHTAIEYLDVRFGDRLYYKLR